MTNSSLKGKSAAVNPYAKKPVISNPYAKKQPNRATAVAVAANNVTPKVKPALPAVKNAVNSSNKQSYNHLNRPASTTVKPTRPVAVSNATRPHGKSNNPYSSVNNNTKTKAVTPTPKKKQILHKHSKPGSSTSKAASATTATTGSINTTRAAASAYTTPKATTPPTNAINRFIPNSKLNAPRKTMIHPSNSTSSSKNHQIMKRTTQSSTSTTRPKSLKQSLKTQIAQIKRRKQLLLQQRELDQQRKKRQLELQTMERQRQREARRILRQQQRRVVQETIGHIVTRVEQRMALEERFGSNKVHYSIAEVMTEMMDTIEQNDFKEKRLIRENKARLRRKMTKERKVIVQQCLSEVVSGVEKRVYGSSSVSYHQEQVQKKMQMQQQQQQQQVQMMMMMMKQQQQQQQYGHQSIIPSSMQYNIQQQQGVIVPHHGYNGAYYPMQMQMPLNTVNGYHNMTMPAMHHHHHHPNMSLPYPQNPPALPPSQTLANPITATVKTAAATNKKPLVLSAQYYALTNPHSPYRSSHHLLHGHNICVMKKDAKDSFGVTLRYESKSVLVPRREEVVVPTTTTTVTATTTATAAVTTTSVGIGGAAAASTTTTTTTTEKKPRRKKRETFGVLCVVEASKARFASSSSSQPNTDVTKVKKALLHPGDIILSVNGRDVVGMTFAESCRFISTSSTKCSVTNEIRCVLTVARRNVPLLPATTTAAAVVGGAMSGTTNNNYNNSSNLRLPNSTSAMQPSTPAIPLVSFSILGETVIGDFSSVEWCAVIRAFPIVSRALTTGMALLPVATKDVCATIKEKEGYKTFLNQRSVESIQAKMSFEGTRIEEEAKQKAEEYWKAAWKGELKHDADNDNNNSLVENYYLTDAQRSILRSKARPTTGCKCGSKTHTFVSDPKCILFRDVKQFCAQNSINVLEDEKKKKGKKISTKGKGKLEAAYIRRFNQLREETAATKEEAEFVLKMEQNQCIGMKKAVFAPSSLCTVVLSAVAAVMDFIPNDRLLDPVEPKMENKMPTLPKPDVDESKKQLDSDDDDSDDEDMPLTALLQPQTSLKRVANDSNLPSPKRPKQNESSIGHKSKAVPSAYVLGEILLHISKTYGHLFVEPSHPNYAWQQRHRSTITTPLPKEVMFAGNPRKPGNLSFENVRFMLTEERLARLKKNWLGNDELKLPPQSTSEEMDRWNDEWTVTHLSSDAVTGIRHEIDVLENLGILRINHNGSVVLAQGWQRRVPHMILNEMKDAWGSDMDVNNLHCIHENIKSSLEDVWEHDDDECEWRFESDSLDDDDDVVYEDEEYELRRQIFLENYDAFVNSRKGVGEFGI